MQGCLGGDASFLHVLRHVAAFVSATAILSAAVCRLGGRAEEVVDQQRGPQPEEAQRSAAQRPAGQPAAAQLGGAERG